MIPALIIPILNRPDLLAKLIDSIDEPIGKLIVIDNGGVTDGMPIQAVRPGHNLGVAASWNLGLKIAPKVPWWLIVNNDITFGRGDLARLAAAVEPRPGLFYLLGMAAFAITAETVQSIGYFDENFHPAYDEDLDYQRRLRLAGLHEQNVEFTGTHAGSATIFSNETYRVWNHVTHSGNDWYYAMKWGGHKQGGETFSTPFNRGGGLAEWTLSPARLAAQTWPIEENHVRREASVEG